MPVAALTCVLAEAWYSACLGAESLKQLAATSPTPSDTTCPPTFHKALWATLWLMLESCWQRAKALESRPAPASGLVDEALGCFKQHRDIAMPSLEIAGQNAQIVDVFVNHLVAQAACFDPCVCG